MRPCVACAVLVPFSLTVTVALWPTTLCGQPAAGRTQRTSFERPAEVRQVTFLRRTPQIGDQADQSLTVRIRVANRIRQGQEIVGETETSMTQRVQRVITTDEVRDERAIGARVSYLVSERQVQADEANEAVQQDPIAGRAYHCRRQGEKLVVTDENGHLPTLAEFEIIAGSMDSLGKPNPLARFLEGKSLTVGEKVTLPDEVAQKFAQRMGEGIDQVEQFHLTLKKVEQIDGRPCAVFEAMMEASESGSRQMKMQLTGPLAVDLGSCRMVEADLDGPIGIAETAMSGGGTYHITGTGRMNFAIASNYEDVE